MNFPFEKSCFDIVALKSLYHETPINTRDLACCVFCFYIVALFHLIFNFSYILISEGAKTSQITGTAVGKPAAFLLPENRKEEKTMLKITSKQADKVHRLVKTCCANCDKDGNCILLDDGEAHRCVQLISIYGIYCNYFKNAVLPSDQELFEQIKKQNKLK